MQLSLVLCLMLTLQSCSRDVRESICLLPKEFTGAVLIIYNQKDGDPPEIERGLYVYRIPKSGIVKTQVPFHPGSVDLEYYYVDSVGQRSPINYKWPDQGHTTKMPPVEPTIEGHYVFAETITTFGDLRFRTFIVGHPNQVDSLSGVADRWIHQKVMEVVPDSILRQ